MARMIRTKARRKCSLDLLLDERPEGILSNTPQQGSGIGKAGDFETVGSRGRRMETRAKAEKGVRLRNTKVTRFAHQVDREMFCSSISLVGIEPGTRLLAGASGTG